MMGANWRASWLTTMLWFQLARFRKVARGCLKRDSIITLLDEE